MIRSMTGYGTGSSQSEDLTVTAEIRTVNHRFLDLHVRVTKEYAFIEPEIQQVLRAMLSRGRVDASIHVQSSRPTEGRVDAAAARTYVQAARRLKDDLDLDGDLGLDTLMGLPGVLIGREAPDPTAADPRVGRLAAQSVRTAVEGVLGMREREGTALKRELERHLESIRGHTRVIGELAATVPVEYRTRLEARLAELIPAGAFDPQRLVQEVALMADRLDVSEELARLESHVGQFAAWLQDGDQIGKKMDFLLQEMQREANTMLSKTDNVEITRSGIGIKADIEKLREQAQNIE